MDILPPLITVSDMNVTQYSCTEHNMPFQGSTIDLECANVVLVGGENYVVQAKENIHLMNLESVSQQSDSSAIKLRYFEREINPFSLAVKVGPYLMTMTRSSPDWYFLGMFSQFLSSNHV